MKLVQLAQQDVYCGRICTEFVDASGEVSAGMLSQHTRPSDQSDPADVFTRSYSYSVNKLQQTGITEVI
ncbi:hypothetical protein PENSUB_10733 [Penicillium subrubescens]|uniref:Uncharacterized protein n=1 Tax=Penicillium subrubescens TaxID=1316194 RepID=A0A1Q5T8N4_9EURO|nr:hypothetical protein PENSUB_10733 [Penicillium subrubescens]